MEKPKTRWITKKGKDKAESPRWVKCQKCGKDNLVFLVDSKDECFVCPACKKNAGDGDKIVSMRCLRHKKRMNVPSWWSVICDWLCPRCFDKLSEAEQEKYRPCGMNSLDVKDAEEGKTTVFPMRRKDEYVLVRKRSDEIKEAKDLEKKHFGNEVQKQKQRGWDKKASKVSDNPSLAALMPRYKIACKKCGETVRCHYSWFDNSTVLCPECYSKMNAYDIEQFHKIYKADRPKMESEGHSVEMPRNEMLRPYDPKNKGWTRYSNFVNSGGYWTNSHIMSATKEELKNAVKMGIVSKPRMRIEMRRRANSDYFDMFSKEVGINPKACL